MGSWFGRSKLFKKSAKSLITSIKEKNSKKLKENTLSISSRKTKHNVSVKSEKKPTVLTLFKNLKSLKTHSMPLSLQLKIGKVPTLFENFKDLLFKRSKVKITPSEKEQRKIYQYFVKLNKRDALFKDMKHKDVKKKFSLTKSKSSILRHMINDYKKGKNLSLILRKSNINLEYLDKKDMDSILNLYKAAKKSSLFDNVNKLKKKMRLTKSDAEIFEKMTEDYKDCKFSLSDIPNISNIDTSDIKKENLIQIIDYYKEHKMTKQHVPFVKQSKLKQWKSDIEAKLSSH